MIQAVAIDSTINWTNIYGVDSNGTPIDLYKNINLYQNRINKSQLSESGKYYLRVQYRDQNLNWSNWSEMTAFNPLGVNKNPKVEQGYQLEQNYPNPFREKTTILYSLPKSGDVSFYIYDINNKLIEVIQQGKKSKGTHEFIYSPRNLNTETLLYEMKVNNIVISRKMICSK